MTTKQAALLAAVAGTLQLLYTLISPFSQALSMMPSVMRSTSFVLSVLRLYPGIVVLGAALPVFLICVYLNEPPLVIPERLRKPALVAAIATGLSVALTVFGQIRSAVSLWKDGDPLFRSNDLLLIGKIQLPGVIWVLGSLTVPLFFLVLSKSKPGEQSVSPALKLAAVYASLVMVFGVAYGIYSRVSIEIFMSTHRALLTAAPGRTQFLGLWYRILSTSLGLFYSGSLAWFFYQFYRTMPTAQSKQRVSSGE